MRRLLLVASTVAAFATGCSAILELDDAVVEEPTQTVKPTPPSVSLADTGALADGSTSGDVGPDVRDVDGAADAKPDAKASD